MAASHLSGAENYSEPAECFLRYFSLFLDSDPEAVEPGGLYIQRPVTRKGLSLITLKRNAILIRPVR